MTTWCLSLPGDPAWWQAFAGILQAVLAVAIFHVTRKYVILTAELVKLQGEIVNLEKQGNRRELYDRRVKVYDALTGFLGQFLREAKVDFPDILQVYRDTREADFLFGAEIPDFIKRVAQSAHKHRGLRADDAVRTGDMEKLEKIHELENWLMGPAFEEARQKFGRYLRLEDPGIPTEGENG